MDRLNNRNGFTIVEVLVVLILIGLIAGILFSRNHQSNAGLVSETAMLKSYLRFVQSLAMSDNTKSWALKIEANQYTLFEDGAASGYNLPDAASSQRTIPATTKVTIKSVTPADTVVFDEWGSPGAQTCTITLGDNSNPDQTITVTKNTGFIP